ncbi:MAG: hypothetical protein IKX19_10465 [Clostridia bacterium]|nr:hypothetical protein [Clostridia bacterium]
MLFKNGDDAQAVPVFIPCEFTKPRPVCLHFPDNRAGLFFRIDGCDEIDALAVQPETENLVRRRREEDSPFVVREIKLSDFRYHLSAVYVAEYIRAKYDGIAVFVRCDSQKRNRPAAYRRTAFLRRVGTQRVEAEDPPIAIDAPEGKISTVIFEKQPSVVPEIM